ncbi:MAG: hypothetical protein JNM62_03695 [Flavobacteriales bacterium]|nr:hypothetical protein [Flavobacteriales bacterium]
MRHLRRALLFLACSFLAFAATAQSIRFNTPESMVSFDLRDLEEGTTEVPGQGGEVAGIDLIRNSTRHRIGDSALYASPLLEDSTWVLLNDALDTLVPGERVHWFRTWVDPDVSLKGVPLLLTIAVEDGFEVFHNGRSLVHGDARLAGSGAAKPDSISVMNVPLMLRCDGSPELLALRFEGDPGKPLRDTELSMTLHPADASFGVQRRVMHFGVFVGINLIIMLLALVIWSLEKRGWSWLLLALLSFVSALDTICEVASEMGLLGLSKSALAVLHALDILLLPWPMYLLILVLGSMGVELTARRKRLYTIGVLLVTLTCAGYLWAERAGLAESENGLALLNDSPWVIIPGLFLITVFGITVAWFSIDVIRLGIRLLRKKGYVRWVGGGAVASSLFALFLNVISSATGLGMSSWLTLVADYCSYVAVPVSVAVYLAIRSAHHNRLVERQRDDLDREVQERTAELRKEKERSDELLLNILPAEVAEELKSQGSAAARHFDEASVLFTDFKGFTSMAAQVDAGELLKELNTCFHAFDDIIDAHGVEKIKTIGDAYMCAGGLPDPRSAGPLAVVLAALEMQEFMLKRRVERMAEGKPAFEMRLGIHTGPVVAGIVGVKKFQYDIWGDTVNTASRMESTGEVGRVNISGATYAAVKDSPGLSFKPRGHVEVKGKGAMEMYFVHRG